MMASKIHNICILLLFALVSCYTRKDGCLDLFASNYDVTADDECVDCCKYPLLRLNISQMVDDSVFRLRDTFVNAKDQMYVIEDIRYYLSGFTVYQSSKDLAIRETISTNDRVITIPNDMKILRGTEKNLEIGSLRAFGKFDSLHFNLGLSPVMTSQIFANLSSNHVLSEPSKLKDSLNNIAYFTMRFKRKKPNEIGDTLSKILIVKNRPEFPTIRVDSSFVTNKGSDIVYSIKTNYGVLLRNLDLKLSADSLSKLVSENLNKMIIVK